MASQVITEICRTDLADPPLLPAAEITDFKHLASYTRRDRAVPTIVVPGNKLLSQSYLYPI